MVKNIFDKLRRPDKNKKNPLTYIVFAAVFGMIIFAFVFMDPGMGGSMYGNNVTAVKVGSTVVPINNYRSRVQNLQQRYSFILNSGNEQMAKVYQQMIQRQAINEIVNVEMLEEVKNKEGLIITDTQVADFILDLDFLQENGLFKQDKYEAFLANSGRTPDKFEKDIRKDLRMEMVKDLFGNSFKAPKFEKEMNAQVKDLSIKVDYVSLGSEDLKKNIKETGFDANAFLAKEENLKSVKSAYDNDSNRFTDKEKVKSRLILVLAEGVDEAAFSKARQKMDEISKGLKPENFAEVARKNSDDPTSAEGGDLGYVERGTYSPEWDSAAFSTAAGQISPIFKSELGWGRLLIEEKIPSKKLDFEMAKTEIAKDIYKETKAKELIEEIKALAKEQKFAEVTKVLTANGLSWKTSSEFGLSADMIPGIGASEKMISGVLSLKKDGDISPELIPVDGKTYLIRRGQIAVKAADKNKPEMIEGRRVDYALSEWLKLRQKDVPVIVNPMLQEEFAN